VNSEKQGFSLFSKPIFESIKDKGFLTPTPAQEKAFPIIKDHKNLLLIAPTGYGKTEAALLPIFDELIREKSPGIAILYITPLRALNRDLLERMESWCRNLDISLAVRHGDTEVRERSKQASVPPQMMITTPETLQAIIAGRVMKNNLKNVRWVIVDEVHEMVDNKRGAQLSLALERLRRIAKFQIIGLSATIGSPERAARFLVGNGDTEGDRNRSKDRDCEIVEISIAKETELEILYPEKREEDEALANALYTYAPVAARLRAIKEIVDGHRSVIIFTNTRSIAETLSSRFKVWGIDGIGVHHGSLSKPTRLAMERDFKEGRMRAIISTSSLELGIDVGNVDAIVQYGSPREVTRILQRVGRSGHRIGRKAKGYIIVEGEDDYFESLVISRRALADELEDIRIPEKPYDVLMHQIAGLLLEKPRWKFDEALKIIKSAEPFKSVDERDLVKILDYMQSIYPRLVWFSKEERVFARARVRERLYNYYFRNLSMIPEEKHYTVIDDKRSVVGFLDESFVLEYGEVGRRFIEGGLPWEIVEITKDRVYVKQSESFGAIPSWAGEEIPVPFEIAQEVGEIRARVEECVKAGKDPVEELCYPFDKDSMKRALRVLIEHANKHPMPTDKRVVVERWNEYVIIHACFGTKQNRALSVMLGELLGGGESIAISTDPYRVILRTNASDEMIRSAFNSLDLLEKAIVRTGLFRKNFIDVLRKCGTIERNADLSRIGSERIMKSFEGTVVWEEALKTTQFKDFEPLRVKAEVVFTDGLTPLGRIAIDDLTRELDILKPERMEKLINEYTKMRLLDEVFTFICCDCWSYIESAKVKEFRKKCSECGSERIGFLKKSSDEVERALFMKKGEEIKKEAEENCELLERYGFPLLLAMAARIKKEDAIKLVVRSKGDESALIPMIIKEERRALRSRYSGS
jgi:ATP-dependent Lhr-like helicase